MGLAKTNPSLRAAHTVRRLLRNRQLRRLMGAWVAFNTGELALFTLLVVFTFDAGGAPLVGAVTLLNVLPSGLLAPLASTLATSRRPHVHLGAGIGARGAFMIGMIVAVLYAAPMGVVLTLVALDSLVTAVVRPLHGALVVRLADTPAEAAAANAATSMLVNAGALIGPASAGLVLRFVGIGWAFALPALASAAGAIAAMAICDQCTDVQRPADGGSVRSHLRRVRTGYRAILDSRPAAAATLLFFLTMMLAGVWDVASAPVANVRLGLGAGGVTTILTLTGIGGLLGALATMSIVGRRGLARALAVAMLGIAVTVAALGAIEQPALGFVLAAGVGAATAGSFAIAPTLMQRSIARSAMVQAAACLQSLYMVGLAAGAIVAPILIESIGVTAALLAVAAAVALTTALSWPELRRADALSAEDEARLSVIRATPLLAPLPALALEQLARAATTLSVPAGADVIRQGESGDQFYVIAAGVADVTVDGQRVGTLGRGGFFGEIALLQHDVRSATVTAREHLDLVSVGRGEFLGALSGDALGRIGGVARNRLAAPPVKDRLVELDRHTALADRSVADLLAVQPPLSTIDAEVLGALADGARLLSATDGTLITREGDYGDAYYVILDGAAQVLDEGVPARSIGPGDGFGEHAIVHDVPQPATVRAVGDTILVAVDRDEFQRARRTS